MRKQILPHPSGETASDRRRSTVRTAAATARSEEIAYWIARLPSASTTRIAGYVGTSPDTVLKWRRARSGG
jgi:DNA-binding CsgD family transcriptional regulator